MSGDVPAFPQSSAADGPFGGMTLRDWFAGQALAGVIQICADDFLEVGETTEQMFASKAYAIADAMLAARKVQP